MDQELAKPQDGEKAEYLPLRHKMSRGWLGMAIFLCLLGFASFALPEPSLSITMPLLLLALLSALLALFTQHPAVNATPRSSGIWLGLAVVLFVAGLVVCGSGSAAVLFLATLSTLPAVLGKRHSGQRAFGVILLCTSLSAGISLYSKQGWGFHSNYLRRAKATEVMSLLASLKPAVEAFYTDKKYCPTPEEVGAKTPGKYVVKVVRTSFAGDTKCVYTATLKDSLGFDANATLGLAYLPTTKTWSCKDQDTGTTKLSPLYLPRDCRERLSTL